MDLVAQTDQLRLEFLAAELNVSHTFARIARFEFENGEPEHGRQSLFYAGRGKDVIRDMLADPKHRKRLTGAQLHWLYERLEELRDEIERVVRSSSDSVGRPILAAAAFQAANRLKAGCRQDCLPPLSLPRTSDSAR